MSLLENTAAMRNDMPSASHLEERNLLLHGKCEKLANVFMAVENLKCYSVEYNLDFKRIDEFLGYLGDELLKSETEHDVVKRDLMFLLRDRG